MAIEGISKQALDEFLEPYMEFWTFYSENHWQFVLDCLRTQNRDVEYGGQRESVPFPDFEYLEFFASMWYTEHALQCDKSRQLTMTWLVCALAVHEAIFRENALIGYQNLSLKMACDKLENYMLYMLKRIPWEMQLPWVKEGEDPHEDWIEIVAKTFDLSLTPPQPPHAKQSVYYGSRAYWVALELSNRYKTSSGTDGMENIQFRPYFLETQQDIIAVPGGVSAPEKWRGFTFTRAIHDEYAFYYSLSDAISSASKTLGKHGFQVLITTPSVGKDGDEVPKKMTEKDELHPNIAAEKGYKLPHGVEMWQTKQQYLHVRIWYYAHPERRTKDYLDYAVHRGDTRKNQREILLRYDIPENEAFYLSYAQQPETFAFSKLVDGKRVAFMPSDDSELLIGQDGGRTPASLIVEARPDGRLVAAFEVCSEKSSIQGHLPKLIALLNRHYPNWQRRHRVFCDPSMFNDQESSPNSAATVMQQAGFRVEPGVQDPDERFTAMSQLIETNMRTDSHGSAPTLLVNTEGCPRFHGGMSGLADIDPSAVKSSQNRKNKLSSYSHIVEAGEYVATRAGLYIRKNKGGRRPPRHWKGGGAG